MKKTMHGWRSLATAVACGALAACGGGGGGGQDASGNAAFNAPPVLSGTPPTQARVGEEYTFDPVASDPDGDVLTFRIANRPAWATFSPTTGRLRGTPGAGVQPTYPDIEISVTDGQHVVALPAFKLDVEIPPPPNTPPSIGGTPPASVVAGNTYSFTPEASDPDAQALFFSVTNLPAWAQFDTVTGRMSGTPSAAQVGIYTDIGISVSDGEAETMLAAFDVEVTSGTTPGPTNRAPTIAGTPPAAVTAGQAYSFRPTASDPDGQALTFSISGKPSWAVFDVATGELRGTPGAAAVGQTGDIVIRVTDGAASDSLPAFRITVLAANNPPQISGTPATRVTAGQSYDFRPTASDPDGNTLSFAIVNKPAWASFSTTTGRLTGTPVATDVKTYSNVSITVSDGAAQATLAPFSIQVVAANVDPTISGTPATSVTAGQSYSFTPSATDPDAGQTLTYSITGKPAWATFSTSTGRLSGTPGGGSVGSHAGITISVSDGTAAASLPAFAIEVLNAPPTIAGSPPATVTAGQPYTFAPSAGNPDGGQTLTYAVSGKPTWANFSTTTGQLTGTPSAAQVGTYPGILISVSDGRDSAVLPAFAIEVLSVPNVAPQITGTPATSVTAGQAYSFTPTATDPDAGQTLTFSIAGKPRWATFSTATGRLSGTPASTDVGTYAGIVISVSDGRDSDSLPAFAITVAAPPNAAPRISGTPPTTVTAGQAYSFTPTATDADAGQTLTFSIAGKPAWASFSTTTGRLSGTPDSTYVGTSAPITITVSDGTASASLPAFTITVAAPPTTGSATLSWTAPTLNEDGSPLTNLQGYRIYYGTSSSNLSQVLEIPDGGIRSAVVEDLAPATWYFALKAYNTSGVESSFSNVASKTIQ